MGLLPIVTTWPFVAAFYYLLINLWVNNLFYSIVHSPFKSMYYTREFIKFLDKSIAVYEMYPPFNILNIYLYFFI